MKTQYLAAVDVAWNQYQTRLTVEQFAAAVGMPELIYRRLRTQLEREGVISPLQETFGR